MGAMKLADVVGGGSGGTRRRSPYFRTKKVALLGCTESIKYAPWHDPSWTLVAHNSARNLMQREPDWWVDLHRPECFKSQKGWYPKYYQWLQVQHTPIFMQEAYAEIPAAVRYPKERILGEFRNYFTNQVSYMIALAITEGATHLGLFGCQYKADTERGVQRESCVYWLGRFEGAGGTVVLPPKYNTLLASPKALYGYASHDAEGRLVPEYQPKAPPAGAPQMTVLQTSEAPPTHMDIGEPVAWERSPFRRPA